MKEQSVADMIRQSRIERRRAHRVAALKRAWPKIALLGAVAALAVWSIMAGPLHSRFAPLAARSTVSSLPSTTPASTGSGPTTSSTIVLAGATYVRGDCVLWDQRVSTSLARVTTVVPCSDTHLIEIIGDPLVPGGYTAPFPTDAQWHTFRAQLCDPLAQPYLGYPLDPAGKYWVGDIHPTAPGWNTSAHRMWCGIEERWPGGVVPANDQEDFAFAGAVKGSDQTYLYGTGTCLDLRPDGQLGGSVSCSQPHGVEITGTITITTAAMPATDQAWQEAIGSRCQEVASRFAGGHLPSGVNGGWMPIEASSWAAGRRTVECSAERFGADGHLLPESGSVRAAG